MTLDRVDAALLAWLIACLAYALGYVSGALMSFKSALRAFERVMDGEYERRKR